MVEVAIFLGILWLLGRGRDAPPVPGGTPIPRPGTASVPGMPSGPPIPIPIPVPAPKPKLQPVPAKPADIPVSPIQISGDCSQAVLAPGWELAISPTVEDAISSGAGLPVYAVQDAARSVDAVIRTVVARHGASGCIDKAPWLDRYAKTNPPPRPQSGESADDFRARQKMWDAQWDGLISAFAKGSPKAFGAFRQIGEYVVGRWMAQRGIGPSVMGGAGADMPKSIPKSDTTLDAQKLRVLGYTPSKIAPEEFQADYNLVQNYLTNFGWVQSGLSLDVDNKLGPKTRAALDDALSKSGANAARWGLIVDSARTN